MPPTKPGIATTIIPPDSEGEGFIEISPNKTLFIQHLTHERPKKAQIIEGLETVEDVFGHFKPSCPVELDREDGSSAKETFNFRKLADFDIKSLTDQSQLLSNINFDLDTHLKIIKQLGSNRALRNVINDPDSKQALINSLKALVAELQED